MLTDPIPNDFATRQSNVDRGTAERPAPEGPSAAQRRERGFEPKRQRAERKKRPASRSTQRSTINGMPNFQLPFKCGEKWRLTTYPEHHPADKKIDFFRVDGSTENAPVIASAPGVVDRTPSPGGVKISHGDKWYTLYLHMTDIKVDDGDKIEAGQEIGEVGNVGTGVHHLHYEQLQDTDGDGQVRAPDGLEFPVLQGRKFVMVPGTEPRMTSTNAC